MNLVDVALTINIDLGQAVSKKELPVLDGCEMKMIDRINVCRRIIKVDKTL